jgi:hypothetical protein
MYYTDDSLYPENMQPLIVCAACPDSLCTGHLRRRIVGGCRAVFVYASPHFEPPATG